MAVLSPEQVSQLAYQAGFRGDALVAIVAIAKRESGYRTEAHRTNRDPSAMVGDFGLLQINYTNVSRLGEIGVTSTAQLLDPLTNLRAAFLLSGGGSNLQPWAAGPGGWTAEGDPLYGTNVQAARSAVTNAQTQGLLGQSWAGTSTPTSSGGAVPEAAGPAGAGIQLPSDARVMQVAGGPLAAAFDLGGGVTIWYDLSGTGIPVDQARVEQVSLDQWSALGWVEGGSGLELDGVQANYGSFNGFWSQVVTQIMGNNLAKDDPGVRRVLAEYAARPDMSDQELQNRLQGTEWYNARTQGQLEWNGLSDAEKQKRRDDIAAQMANAWMSMAGVVVDVSDPRIQNYVDKVASGELGYGAWTEQVVKQSAEGNPESPWSRQVREEQETQRQRPVDIENTAHRVRDLAKRWGVQISDGKAMEYGKAIIEKTSSEADVINTFKGQAQQLYQWKDPDLETMTAAGPWMETYKRVMEQEGDIFNPKVQSALTAGKPPWEFEQELKKSSDWLGTRNARSEMFSIVAEAGRKMGFVA
ncbi:MAG TPA: transglycosylase SLT domain-containing protein [Acidimicrobiia bacterium]|nr:transglycosylase SLT domain-containing protein [Acidimicrobiia bacterium]